MAVKMGAVYRKTVVCEALVRAIARPTSRNSSENRNPSSRPLGSEPSANARRPSDTSTQVPKNTAAMAKRTVSCITGGVSAATPFIATC